MVARIRSSLRHLIPTILASQDSTNPKGATYILYHSYLQVIPFMGCHTSFITNSIPQLPQDSKGALAKKIHTSVGVSVFSKVIPSIIYRPQE